MGDVVQNGNARYKANVSATNVDLTKEDYDDSLRWTKIQSQDTALAVIMKASSYFDDSFGLSGSFDTWTQAYARGTVSGYAGSAGYHELHFKSNAVIADDADIQLSPGSGAASDTNTVKVAATVKNDAVQVNGNFNPPGFRLGSDAGGTTNQGMSKAMSSHYSNAFSSIKNTRVKGLGADKDSKSAKAVGAAFNITDAVSEARAKVGKAKIVAHNLDVSSKNTGHHVVPVAGGGKANDLSLIHI